ncbi:hypothetical protein [Sphingomonas xanthus]|nr:hypothetical protein [Sphingomonas xanthus]
MTSEKNKLENREEQRDRTDGKAPVKQGGNPSPSGQDEPRNEDVSKQTI